MGINLPSLPLKKNSTESFAEFSQLDGLGRAGVAFANIGPDDLAPAGSRQSIGSIKPSGWNQNKYEGIVNTNPPYLYNRCHLIAHELLGNDTEVNLITGTRYLNEAMIEKENNVTNYIRVTGNHVLYRATPIYSGDNLVASGVQLEAYSVEDNGEGICFNVYYYNVQPGVDINYQDGTNEQSDTMMGSDDVLPFVVYNPSDSNPDLIYEMNKYLDILFEDQKNTGTYSKLMIGIDGVAIDARAALDEYDGNQGKYYIELKKYEYKYLEQLTLYVPTLLSNEEFFSSVFQ